MYNVASINLNNSKHVRFNFMLSVAFFLAWSWIYVKSSIQSRSTLYFHWLPSSDPTTKPGCSVSSCRLAVFCFICYCSRNIFKRCQFSEHGCTLVLQITKDSLFSKQCLSEIGQMLVEIEFKVFILSEKSLWEALFAKRLVTSSKFKGPFSLC